MFNKYIFLLFTAIFMVLSTDVYSQVTEEDILKEILPESEPSPPPETPEEIKEEVKEAVKEISEVEREGDLGETLKVGIEGQVSLSYVFAESPDSFLITYRFSLDGLVRNKIDVLKGRATVSADVKGLLAKWPTGECNLQINVSEVPYELIFNKFKEEEARVEIRFLETILEKWQSLCNFADAPGAKFNTTGNPEKWLDAALQKTSPGLRDILAPLSPREITMIDFTIARYQLPDAPLGSVEIEGKGKVTIAPGS